MFSTNVQDISKLLDTILCGCTIHAALGNICVSLPALRKSYSLVREKLSVVQEELSGVSTALSGQLDPERGCASLGLCNHQKWLVPTTLVQPD